MNKKLLASIFWVGFITLAAIYFGGIKSVPFHPDESSYLYQSQEFEILLSAPLSLAWTPEKEIDPLLRYRLLDAPLHRYAVGLGQWIAGFNAASIPNDWNWSMDWEKNLAAGAMPDPELLFIARMVSTSFTLGAIFLIYLFTKKLAGNTAGLIAAIVFGLNGLTLLHGRRAMAEGILLFGISLALWSIWQAGKRPWLAGICFAIAACAKYSLVVLFPVGLLAVIWLTPKSQNRNQKIWKNALIFLITFGLLCWLLHPVLWSHPISGFQEMINIRHKFTNSGIEILQTLGKYHYLHSTFDKVIALISQLFIAPPAYADVGNYLANTAQSVFEYEKISFNTLLRGYFFGGVLMVLSIFGGLISVKQVDGMTQEKRKILILFSAVSLIQVISLLIILPFSFQRYYLPLLPIISIWAGLGLQSLLILLKNNIRKTRSNAS